MIASLKKYYKEILVGISFLGAYVPILVWMKDRWSSPDSYYSHGILIPFVSIYLIWQKREELREVVKKSSPWGWVLILLGLGAYVVSAVFRVYFSAGFSMLFVLCGLILHFYGKEVFRKILFPVCFLFFMFPLPEMVIANISFKMKIFAAEISERWLNSMGFYAVRDGSSIIMKHTQVIVDDVCSGLRSLISLAALGSIFAYWLNGPVYKRIILFLATIPIAIITNVCRVVLLSAVSEIWGAEYIEGFIHDSTGFMVFALAFILLCATSKLIE